MGNNNTESGNQTGISLCSRPLSQLEDSYKGAAVLIPHIRSFLRDSHLSNPMD